MSFPSNPHQGRPDFLDRLQRAVALHQQGRLGDAEQLYRDVLAGSPDQFDALHLLGVIRIQSGQHREGADLIRRALRVIPIRHRRNSISASRS
jgi:hypothetical protein